MQIFKARLTCLFSVGDIVIDSRIKAVMNFVPKNSRVADIGADHGYLAIELVKNSVASYVVASDKNAGPLDAAKKNIAAAGLSDFIEVRLGDGLKVLNAGEVDTICIAGMGGALIAEILNDSPEVLNSARQLILQPMNAVEKVQGFLKNHGWHIADIELAEVGGIIYEIISAVKNIELVATVTKKENSPLLKKFIKQKILKLQRVLDEMSKSSAAVRSDKFKQIQLGIEELKFQFNTIELSKTSLFKS